MGGIEGADSMLIYGKMVHIEFLRSKFENPWMGENKDTIMEDGLGEMYALRIYGSECLEPRRR